MTAAAVLTAHPTSPHTALGLGKRIHGAPPCACSFVEKLRPQPQASASERAGDAPVLSRVSALSALGAEGEGAREDCALAGPLQDESGNLREAHKASVCWREAWSARQKTCSARAGAISVYEHEVV